MLKAFDVIRKCCLISKGISRSWRFQFTKVYNASPVYEDSYLSLHDYNNSSFAALVKPNCKGPLVS